MNKKLKISIDYHGVINADPQFFKNFNTLAIEKKYEIHVLSGGSFDDVFDYLKKHQIPYTHIFSILDYFKTQNLVTFYKDGSFHVQDEIWNKAKAQYCKDENINLHIDDSLLYGTYFQTPFCLYDSKEQLCDLVKKDIRINFKQTAQKVLQDIEKELNRI